MIMSIIKFSNLRQIWLLAVITLGSVIFWQLQTLRWIYLAFIWQGILALLAFFYPFLGLCIFVFLIPLEEISLISEKMTFLKIIGLIVFAGWLKHILIYKRDRLIINRSFLIAFSLFGLWGVASTLWAQDTWIAFERWITMLLLVGFFFLVIQMADDMKKLYWLILSNIAGIIVAGALGLYNFFTVGLSPQWRISALLNVKEGQYVQNPGHYGILLALGIFYFLVLFLFRRGFCLKVSCFLGFSGLLVAALASGTRSFMVSFAVGLLTLFWYLWRVGTWKKFIPLGALVTVTAIIIAMVMPPYFFERVESVWTLEDRGSGRLDFWKVFLVVIAENPILGVGLGNGPLRYDEYRLLGINHYGISLVHPGAWTSGRDPHNIYLQIWAELGTIGFVFFMLLIIDLARQMYQALKIMLLYSWEWQLGLVIALNFVALLATGLSEPSLIRKYLWFGFALVSAYAYIVKFRKNLIGFP